MSFSWFDFIRKVSDWVLHTSPNSSLKAAGDNLKASFSDHVSPAGYSPSSAGIPGYSQEEYFESALDNVFDKIGDAMYSMSGAKAQNAFTKMMSDTAIQRGKNDAEAAGFNPLLAFGGGSGSIGASSNNSASGTGGSNFIPAMLNGIANIVSTSIHAASNDNRTLTMANNASAINTARILSNEDLLDKKLASQESIVEKKLDYQDSWNSDKNKYSEPYFLARAAYYEKMANESSMSKVNNAKASYYKELANDFKRRAAEAADIDNKNPNKKSKNAQWVDDYWKNYK